MLNQSHDQTSALMYFIFFLTLPLQDPHAEEFEDKEWTFVIENVSTTLFYILFASLIFSLLFVIMICPSCPKVPKLLKRVTQNIISSFSG